jgi:hypothetical protein
MAWNSCGANLTFESDIQEVCRAMRNIYCRDWLDTFIEETEDVGCRREKKGGSSIVLCSYTTVHLFLSRIGLHARIY